jgi:hypothetical protein
MSRSGLPLALGAVGVLAVAGFLRARGSINEAALSPLQKRLLYLVEQYPEPTASYVLLFAAALPGVRLERAGWARNLTGWESDYYLSTPNGRTQFEDDLRGLGIEPKAWAKDTVKKGVWYDQSAFVARSGWEPLLPWIGKEINRIVKTLPPIRQVSASSVAREAKGFLALDLDAIRRLQTYFADKGIESAELRAKGQGYNPSPKRQTDRFDANRIADIFGADSQLIQRKGGYALYVGRLFKYLYRPGEPPPTPEQILIHLHLERLYKLLPEIRDWFGSGTAGDLGKLTYADAAKKAKVWHRQIEQAAGATKGAKKSSTEGTIVARLAGGWTIQELDAGDLRPQSEAMGHCVGRSDTYRNMIRDGKGKIFSVRDGAGRSVFTLEARADGFDGSLRVVQFKGAGNRIPGLTKEKTKKAPYGAEVVKEWIERAKKSFVSMTDADRAVEVVRALQGRLGGAQVITFPTRDLDVVRAMGKMP